MSESPLMHLQRMNPADASPQNWPYAQPATERVAVIINRNARQVGDKIIKKLQHFVPAEDLFVSASLEESEAFARQIVQKGYGTVVCGGGDGTLVNAINQICHYIDESNEWRKQRARYYSDAQPLMPYPEFALLKLGTGNGLSSVVGSDKPAEDIQKILTGPKHAPLSMDLIESEGKRFIFAGLGYDAWVLNDYVRLKKWSEKNPILKSIAGSVAGYLLAVVSLTVPNMLQHGFSKEVKVTNVAETAYFMDSRRGDRAIAIPAGQLLFEGSACLVGVGTSPFYGFGFKVYPFAGVMPGYMNLRIATIGPINTLAHLPSIWNGTFRGRTILDFLVKNIRVESEQAMPYQYSGDAQGMRQSVEFKMASTPLKLVDYRGSLI